MFPGFPSSSEIICNTRTTTGTLITIPAGKWYTGNISMTASVAALGASAPVVTTAGTDVSPAAGTVIARCDSAGLLASASSNSSYQEIIVLAPSENDVTLEFTAGASGVSSATVNGYIY
jgi:hypothetical protein